MTPATPAVHKIIRTLRSPISITDLIQEVNELLEYEGKSATYQETMIAIGFVCKAGADEVLRMVPPYGNDLLPQEPPALLIIDDERAIPAARADVFDIINHTQFMARFLADEAARRTARLAAQ